MKIFTSALDSSALPVVEWLIEKNYRVTFGLASYYYIQKSKSSAECFRRLPEICDEILIDSGAHSFQVGNGGVDEIDWDKYAHKYAEWIKENDNDKIIGYFELDVDVVIGYEKVKELRKVLEAVTDKIIPVWHKNRGIEGFKRMCHETKGNIVAITGFRNEDIKDNQYGMFVKYAHQCGKKIHCLGMTRTGILSKIPFDYTDSSSWIQAASFGKAFEFDNHTGKMKSHAVPKSISYRQLRKINILETQKMAKYYNLRWARICKDKHFKWRFAISRLIKLGGIFNEKRENAKYGKDWNYCSTLCGGYPVDISNELWSCSSSILGNLG